MMEDELLLFREPSAGGGVTVRLAGPDRILDLNGLGGSERCHLSQRNLLIFKA